MEHEQAATWSLAQQIGDKLRSMEGAEVRVTQHERFVAVSGSQVYAGLTYEYTLILSPKHAVEWGLKELP